jgi:predicted dehydrogenase
MNNELKRRDFMGLSAGALIASAAKPKSAGAQAGSSRPIRLGFVGVGDRGSYHLDIALGIEGVEVPAICDINPAKLYQAKRWIEESGRPTPRLYGRGRTDFERLCAEEDLDCVICSTSWKPHAAVHESTGKWATLGFKSVNSTWTNIVHQGVLGDIIHCEGGYVHDLRLVKFDPEREPWRLQHSVHRNGNLYPDHPTCGLMPVMDINHGDRFDHLVSMSSRAVMLNQYADLLFGPAHPYSTQEMKQGDFNCTLLRTAKGKMYTLNFDTNTPHPRGHYRIQGTRGCLFMPNRRIGTFIYRDGISPEEHRWEPAEEFLKENEHPLQKAYEPPARETIRGHGGGERGTPFSWHRLMLALRENRITDFDVYDSVTSSAISPLTEASVANNSEPIDFPDFTKGQWKDRLPVEVAYHQEKA